MLAFFSLQMNVCAETLIQTQHTNTFCANAEMQILRQQNCNHSLFTLQKKPSTIFFGNKMPKKQTNLYHEFALL